MQNLNKTICEKIFVQDNVMYVKNFLKKNIKWCIFFLLLVIHIFLRFYQIELRSPFGWDQVDSAWAAKKIIVDHIYPIFGPVAKWGSGVYIGPIYFYLLSIFYFITNLDPVAAGLYAGAVSIFTFFTIFFVIKKLFSFNIALVALFINTIAFPNIQFDRIQWEVNFISAISLLTFYALYKIITGNEKYILLLSFLVGIAFHVHLTTLVFIPIIVFLSFPLFPKNMKIVKYLFYSSPVFFILLSPILYAVFYGNSTYASHSFQYLNTYFHGLYATRILQLAPDAFIQFQSFFVSPLLYPLKYILLPLFFIIYLHKFNYKKVIFCYLVLLWFLVPWVVLSTYSGEITDYYYSLSRPIVLFILAYLIFRVIEIKNLIITGFFVLFAVYYSFLNIQSFFNTKNNRLFNYKNNVIKTVKEGKVIPYIEGSPESYIYYIYTRKK